MVARASEQHQPLTSDKIISGSIGASPATSDHVYRERFGAVGLCCRGSHLTMLLRTHPLCCLPIPGNKHALVVCSFSNKVSGTLVPSTLPDPEYEITDHPPKAHS